MLTVVIYHQHFESPLQTEPSRSRPAANTNLYNSFTFYMIRSKEQTLKQVLIHIYSSLPAPHTTLCTLWYS